MKKAGCWFLVFLVLFSSASMIRSAGKGRGNWENPYLDVSERRWSYEYIMDLSRAGILPVSEDRQFEPAELTSRGDMALYLYNMDKELFPDQKKAREKAQKKEKVPTPEFTDVTEESLYRDAAAWAAKNELISAVDENTFEPDRTVTRQQVCAVIARFVLLEELEVPKTAPANQFVDSLRIQGWARSSVTACQMAGYISGRDDGYFDPADPISRESVAVILARLMETAETEPEKDAVMVDFTPGAYDSYYDSYREVPYTTSMDQSDPAPNAYFDRAVFIGDSVSLALEYYSNASGALGSAQFLCAGNMSATTILTGEVLPEYPKGSGQKPPLADSVAATGAKVAYIMLGMDNIGLYGVDKSCDDMVTVVEAIKQACPNIKIVIQSVTPVADSSTVNGEKLNNEIIAKFNSRLYSMCKEHGWYYLNVIEAVRDSKGYLKREYCSDYGKMGLHMSNAGVTAWIDYLKTHVPEPLLRDVTH